MRESEKAPFLSVSQISNLLGPIGKMLKMAEMTVRERNEIKE